jgi:superfamily II DNA or RNA helicase
MTRERNKAGDGWNQARALSWPGNRIHEIPDQQDREIVAILYGASRDHWSYNFSNVSSSLELPFPFSVKVVELMCRTGRCTLKTLECTDAFEKVLSWDEGEPWTFRIRVAMAGSHRSTAAGELYRGDERFALKDAALVLPGLVIIDHRVSRLEHGSSFHWISAFRQEGQLEASPEEGRELLAELLQHPSRPLVEAAEEIGLVRLDVPPKPALLIRAAARFEADPKVSRAEVWFVYGDWRVAFNSYFSRGFYDKTKQVYVARDEAAERAAMDTFYGLRLPTPSNTFNGPSLFKISPSRLPSVVRTLLAAGWHVQMDGKGFRQATSHRLEVTSEIDWFDLNGEFDFDGASVKLPPLLHALRKGETIVALDDGTYGMLPPEWLARFSSLAQFGDTSGNSIRFRRSQAGLLDALLASQPETTFDEGFARARDELKRFHGVEPAEQPEGFEGQLRGYQKEGLGWMEFLRRFGFGGCLADDMGVGKTAQVLALLETRRALRQSSNGHSADRPKPSLVVVPRSLIFNWKQEAARFTPQLRVLDHSGVDRSTSAFQEHDVILTTYGILRRDAVQLHKFDFDYVVLDEAQAIKNAGTDSAKAVRLLRASHRLAMSGTPVENHLGELASLFEFLNPGMLGSGGAAQLSAGLLRNPSPETRAVVGHALRPFILRRTKGQVAKELPPKNEQTIYCEMEADQRKLYNELRDYYRNSLLNRVEEQGLAKSKMHVLEALLRLRQAACHPGLLDRKRSTDCSAKLDLLMGQLPQVIEEGHKALVFSQFTSLLAIVKKQLDERKIQYEYLDGKTKNRQERVEHFQGDDNCRLFLVSLKAGGLGLNLTAAEYVYLLDPWWNPAVEAQAIDRTHRIGQLRQVFAYRIITRGTVEEKVLELQNTKRDLAAAIIGEDNSLIRDLRREDLEMLLS